MAPAVHSKIRAAIGQNLKLPFSQLKSDNSDAFYESYLLIGQSAFRRPRVVRADGAAIPALPPGEQIMHQLLQDLLDLGNNHCSR